MLSTEEGPHVRWVLHHVLKTILELLHPIVPFVTEEIWQCLPGRDGDSIVVASYPRADGALSFPEEAGLMDTILEVISGVRSIRGRRAYRPLSCSTWSSGWRTRTSGGSWRTTASMSGTWPG